METDSANPAGGAAHQSFGCQWPLDAFDVMADRLMAARLSAAPKGEKPRAALDIGCMFLQRAHDLSGSGLFDVVLAVDLVDRTSIVQTYNADFPTCAPVRFLLQNAARLDATLFAGYDIAFVNCRNVAHFLSPADFRAMLGRIKEIAPGALLALSFDDTQRYGAPRYIVDNVPDFYSPHRTAYAPYRMDSVERFLNGLGYEVIEAKRGLGYRDTEACLLARVPLRGPGRVRALFRRLMDCRPGV